jgi:glycosyltransferase involved in cell wall biosynthesis
MEMNPLITHVIPSLQRGGAERLTIELAARLPSRGFRTKIVSMFNEGDLRSEAHDRNIRWSTLNAPKHGSRIGLARDLEQMLFPEPERRSAIIHSHLFGGDFWSAIAWLLHSIAHPFEKPGTGDQAARRPGGQRRPLPVARLAAWPPGRPIRMSTAHNVDKDDSFLRRIARGWAVRRTDVVIAISVEVSRYLQESLGVKQERIRVIPNGIDLSRVIPRGARPFHDVPRILMVGRLVPQKGYETALEALAGVSSPWLLDIAGVGWRERDLKELAERLGIASRVRFLGERSDDHALMSEADLFLFPSLWEGMGLALMEAMAAGVPVLASDIPAIRDFLPAEFRIPPKDTERWTERIRGVMASPRKAIESAEQLIPGIRQEYDIELMADRYAALYRKMLSERASGHQGIRASGSDPTPVRPYAPTP